MINFSEFTKNAVSKLIEDGASLFPEYKDIPISEELKYLPLHRSDGSVLFVYHFIQVRLFQSPALELLVSQIKAFDESSKNNHKFSMVISACFFIGCGHNPIVMHMQNSAETFFDQTTYAMLYYVNLDDETTICSANQPENLIKVADIVSEGFRKEAAIKDAVNNLSPKTAGYKKLPVATFVILIINTLFFAVMEMNGGSTIDNVYKLGGFSYHLLTTEPYRLFSSIFLHFGFLHFIANSSWLLIFGMKIEKVLSRFHFVFIYLASGAIASFFQGFFSRNAIVAGASGAIFGILGSCLIWMLISKKKLDSLDFKTLLMMALFSILIGFTQENVGNIAHISGFFSGAILELLIILARKLFVKHVE